jgi:hypothetical protein
MKLVKEHINEKFKEKSDPIRDMKIGINFPEDFEPIFRLLKLYPGMEHPLGTIFGKRKYWTYMLWAFNIETKKLYGNSNWELTYFTPWIGEYFEKI